MKRFSMLFMFLSCMPTFLISMDIDDEYEFTLEDKNNNKIKFAYKYIKTSQTFSNLLEDIAKEEYEKPIELPVFLGTMLQHLKDIWPLFLETKTQELLQKLATISIEDLFGLVDLTNYLDIKQNNQELFAIAFSVLVDRLRKHTGVAELTKINPSTKIRKDVLRQLLLPLLLHIKDITPFDKNSYQFTKAKFSPDGMFLRTLQKKKYYGDIPKATLWNLSTKEQIKIPAFLSADFLWAPNGTFLLEVNPDRLRKFSYNKEWKDIHEITYRQTNYLMNRVTISPDSTEIAAIVDNVQNKNQHITIFDNNLQEKINSIPFHFRKYSWAPDGRIALIDVQVIKDEHFKWDDEYIYNVVILNKELDKQLAKFKVKKEVRWTPGGGTAGFVTLAWSTNSRYLATCISSDVSSFLQIFDIETNKELLEVPMKDPIGLVSWSKDDQFMVTNRGIIYIPAMKWVVTGAWKEGVLDFCPNTWNIASTEGVLAINFTEKFDDFKDFTIAEAVAVLRVWEGKTVDEQTNTVYRKVFEKNPQLQQYLPKPQQPTKNNDVEMIQALQQLTSSLKKLAKSLPG